MHAQPSVPTRHADPAEYAHTWIRDVGHRPGSAAYQELTQVRFDDSDTRKVEAIGFGVLTLRRPNGARAGGRRVRGSALPGPMGPTVAAGLAARDWLADHPGDAVLEHDWRCAPDVMEERYSVPGAADPTTIRLTQGGGLRRRGPIGHVRRGSDRRL